MDPTTFWVVVLVLAALAAVVVAYAVWRGRPRIHRDELRRRFGPEYERLVEDSGSGKAARRELRRRVRRVGRLRLRELTPEQHARFTAAWQQAQARFVDEPRGAIDQSDRLIHEVMRAHGYPIEEDFDRELAVLSVHHANVVQHYRAARALAQGRSEGRASTEDLRQAMVHHRALFADLLRTPIAADTRVTEVTT